MNKIKAAIIEDEVPAARLLSNMLQELRPEWEIILLPGTIEESVEWFRNNPHPDILFLDIQLTDGISFMFIEQAKPFVNQRSGFQIRNTACVRYNKAAR